MANGNSYPLNIAQTLSWKTRNFPSEVYDFNPGDNLTILMSVLLGNTGTGQLDSVQTAARLSSQYLNFSDLENTIGELLRSPRLVSEQYATPINPFIDQLTTSQWVDVALKDSNYRERLIALAAALLKGATTMGIQASAEAVLQTKVQVIENWTNASTVMTASGLSRGFGVNEVIIIPNVPSGVTIASGALHATLTAVENIKPVGSVITIASGINNFVPIPFTSISGNSEFFFLDRQVTANNVNIPNIVLNNTNPSVAGRYWLKSNATKSAPQFAYLHTQESQIDFTSNITNVNITPITSSGTSLASITSTDPLGYNILPITSTFFGSQ